MASSSSLSTPKSTVVLTMLIKDEFPILQRCIRSFKPHIDAWCIVDTGSVDTGDKLAELMLEDLPGWVYHRKWVNFGHNRAELIKLAAEFGDYLLLSDADNELVVTGERPAQLTKDFYNVCTREPGSGGIWTPRLIAARRPWVYVGTTHEYLAIVTPTPTDRGRCTWWEMEHHCDGARRPRKASEDEQMLRDELTKDPNNERVVFYLANVLRDQGKYKEALRFYDRRVQLGGWEQEVALAKEQAARFRRGDFTPVGVPGIGGNV